MDKDGSFASRAEAQAHMISLQAAKKSEADQFRDLLMAPSENYLDQLLHKKEVLDDYTTSISKASKYVSTSAYSQALAKLQSARSLYTKAPQYIARKSFVVLL